MLVQYLEKCTKLEIIISSLIQDAIGQGFYDVLDTKVLLVEEKFYCRGFNLGEETKTSLDTSLRCKGCMSKRLFRTANVLGEIGMLIKLEKLKSSLKKKSMLQQVCK